MTNGQAGLDTSPITVTLPGPSWAGHNAVCIDSATDMASLALVRAGVVVGEQNWHAGMAHSRSLVPTLQRLAQQSGYALAETTIVCVCTGPGSFNGIRAGMGTAIGLATGLAVPIYGASALDLLAFPHADRAPVQRALLPAGRGEFYSALFGSRGGRWRRLTAYVTAPLATLVEESPAKCLWCGPLSPEVTMELADLLGGARRLVAPPHNVRRAAYLLTLALSAAEAGATGIIERLEPLYLRRPAITTPRMAAVAGV